YNVLSNYSILISITIKTTDKSLAFFFISKENKFFTMVKQFQPIYIFIIFCTSVMFFSCSSKEKDTSQQNISQSNALTVNGIVVQPQQLENIVRSSGTVLASESVDLTAEAAGRIEKISFVEGAHVQNNEILVRINDDDLQAQLKKTELQIQLASEQEKRQRQLFDINGISKEQYDISLNQVNTLKADRENLVASIRKREIRAPFDGIIGLRYISEGGYVSPTTRIASIQKINPLKIDFAIPEKYAADVSIGDLVQFSSEETDLNFMGKIYAIEPKIDPVTRTLQLRALCSNKSEKIFPGAFVHIELRLKNITNALMVPTQAVIPVLKGQTILLRKDGLTVSVPVKTGIRTATTVQILNGLSAGDTVITSGLMQLRPGVPVNVVVK
ncbi:MAG: efflux RND transporter periplasmic adaptor subunit, partial [Bacteroidota bacterium]|nr:efflux RND transporter periplasmic adaptor subunit [Bacteroidota bacterium]